MPSAPAFWLVALLMLAATVAALVWPLLRRRGAVRVEAEDAATTDVSPGGSWNVARCKRYARCRR